MKVLVLCLPGIGDALMATPMIRVLSEECPSATIDVACMFGGVEYVFMHNKNVSRIHYLPIYKEPALRGLRHVLRLRDQRYDVSVLAFPAFRREYHAVARIIGAEKRVAHRFGSGAIREWHFLNTELVPVDDAVHNVINNMNLVHVLGINWEAKYSAADLRYDLTLDPEAVQFGQRYLQTIGWDGRMVVGVHPGSIDSRAGLYKRWPSDRWVQLIDRLNQREGLCVLVFYGGHEATIADYIHSSVRDQAKCHRVAGLSFSETLGVLANVSALVSNDNGFAHLANALQVQGVVLFGPTNLRWCAPYDTRFTASIRRATFRPWFLNDMKVTKPPRDAESGMEKIEVEDVVVALRDIMIKNRPAGASGAATSRGEPEAIRGAESP
jgi:ADP-heptose:LPS heptosyltransferase